jgi:DNA polymerase elongation subunit (family B)
VFYRGIELRRHDSPKFLKHFQQQLLNIILEAESHDDITHQQLPKAIRFTVEMVEKIRSGSVSVNELIISKMLRMPIERYRSLFPHVTAAVQLQQRQKPIKPGELIDYVYVDTAQINPINRVAPAEYAETYDAEKYAEMLLDIAESILSVFGFSRTKLGFQSKPHNFLEELRSERTKEILMELDSLQP